MSDGDVQAQARVRVLKGVIDRITQKREKKVITNLVKEYKGGELTQEKAYAAIMVIAELRSAGNDVGTDDL